LNTNEVKEICTKNNFLIGALNLELKNKKADEVLLNKNRYFANINLKNMCLLKYKSCKMFKLYINSYYDMLLYYIIISVILFILVLHGYNKIKYKFWINQAIFYRYNIVNWFYLNSILLFENPKERLHLNFLNNNVSYITDTYIDKQVGNIYMNEIDKSIKYST
jgi:hypothetical protein